jgi:hypothetical protein
MPTKEQLEQLGNLPSEIELMKKGFDPSTFYHGSPEEKHYGVCATSIR